MIPKKAYKFAIENGLTAAPISLKVKTCVEIALQEKLKEIYNWMIDINNNDIKGEHAQDIVDAFKKKYMVV